MYCNHCGKPNEDGTKICTSCGQEIQRTEDAVIPRPQQMQPNENTNSIGDKLGEIISKIDTDKIKAKLDGMDKKKIAIFGGIAGGALALFIAVLVIITSCTTKIKLKNYIADELEYTGINGYGSVVSEADLIDWDSLQNDILKKKMKQSDYNDDYYYYYSSYIGDYITIECTSENNGTLSNGDEIEYTFTINKDAIKENPRFGKMISGGETQTFTFKVEGLAEATKIDVFDAVDYVTIDSTYYNSTKIVLKENYVKQYDNDGINVRVENGYINVYGDSFQSFSIYLNLVNDNFDETSTSVKLAVDCDADSYKGYGIVLAETEADVDANVISYVRYNTISKEDLNKLTQKVNNVAKERLDGEAYKVLSAVLYYDTDNNDNSLAYYIKSDDRVYMIFYNYLKQYNDGSIVDIDDIEPRTYMTFYSYDTVSEAESDGMTFTEKVAVPLS